MATVPDPDEPDRRDPPRSDSSADTDTDAAFASIVAGWRVEPEARPWPTEEDRTGPDPTDADRTEPDRLEQDRVREDQPARGTGQRPLDPDDDHFEPPEPPPLPIPQPRTMGGLLLVAVGLLLLVNPDLLTMPSNVATPLGLLGMAGGIGWLMFNLRGGPPPEGWDDGARL